MGQEPGLDEIVALFAARGPEVRAVAGVAGSPATFPLSMGQLSAICSGPWGHPVSPQRPQNVLLSAEPDKEQQPQTEPAHHNVCPDL